MDDIKNTMIKHKKDQIKENKKKIKEKKGAIELLTEKLEEVDVKIAEEHEKRKAEQRADPSIPMSYVFEVPETLVKRKKNIKATISRHKTEIARIKAGPIHTLRTEREFFQSIKPKEVKLPQNSEAGDDAGQATEATDEKGKEKVTDNGDEEKMVDEVEDSRPRQTLEELIEAYGSKMAHLIHYIRKVCEQPDTRIIIFSQWERMLQKVGATLTYVLLL